MNQRVLLVHFPHTFHITGDQKEGVSPVWLQLPNIRQRTLFFHLNLDGLL